MDPNEGAIVIYEGPKITNGNEETKEGHSKATKKYIGLSNQGATCYMNSFLQTLFMTPEFRTSLYGWRYNEVEHVKPQDCIPLQLQKVFAGLQLKLKTFVQTRDLTKSFQWDNSNSYEQQDVQEFCRILFDAIEESTKLPLIHDLYEGTSVSYTKCLVCGYESNREENFLDINLSVKNPFDKIYNESLEKAFQNYLKPELLSGTNQYFCETCNMKVDAQRGTKFLRMPKILCTIINRFSFDYVYMRRVKLDDYFSFPTIFNMNDYINGYDGIKNKLSEEANPDAFLQHTSSYSSTKATTKKPVAKSTVAGKPARASTGTKSFIQEMKKKKAEQQNSIEVVIKTKDVNELLNPPPLHELLNMKPSTKIQTEEEESAVNTSSTTSTTNVTEPTLDKNKSTTSTNSEDTGYFVKKEGEKFSLNDVPLLKKESEVEDEDTKKSKEEKEQKLQAERKETIEKYLKEGPLVYELYSILIHSGGAYGGHYYAYIKSFEDGKWYNFNDMNVTEVDADSIPSHTFGGGKSTNAYMLLYRQIEGADEVPMKITETNIPDGLKEMLQQEQKKEEEIDAIKLEKSKEMYINVFHQLLVKKIPTSLSEKYADFEAKAFEAYGITDKKNNRLRVYQPQSDTLLDTFTNRGHKTLQELRIFSSKAMAVEVKKDEDVFEEFDADAINFKVTLWRENITDLNEETLLPKKISVNKFGTLNDLVDGVSKEFNIPTQKVRLVKKTLVAGLPIPEILTVPENDQKPYVTIKVFEGMLLYLEEVEDHQTPTKWREEFEKDAFRYRIKYNNPLEDNSEMAVQEYNYSCVIDARLPMEALKEEICKIMNLKVSEVIIRKGGRLGNEIKDLNQTITSASFVNGSSIYVELGKPTKPGEMRIIVYLAEKIEPEEDMHSHTFKEVYETVIHGDNTAAEVKAKIAEEVKSMGYEWDPINMRLREKTSDRMIKVYRNQAMKLQGVIDKKAIAVELISGPERFAPRDNLLICRIWSPDTLDLGPRFEIIVDSHTTLSQVANKIREKNESIQVENMMGCKLLGTWKYLRYDLLTQEWHSLNDDQNTLYSHPFYVTQDGGILILKDKSIKEKELTEEEKKQIGVFEKQIRGQGYNSGPFAYKPGKEKSIKITVKKKEDYKIEEDLESERLAKELQDAEYNQGFDGGKKGEKIDEEFEPFF